VIVADASVLAAFLLKEGGWKKLARYLELAISVDFVAKEVANAIWKAHLRGMLSKENAEKAYALLKSMLERNLELADELDYLDRAVEIVLEQGITVYDALYLALAERRSLPLATLDIKQKQAAKALGVEVIPLEE